jgi:C-terminal processing protease CtpA/Prc
MNRRLARAILVTVVVMFPIALPAGQMSSVDRARVKQMARQIFDQIREHYFDASFGGRDLNAISTAVGERIDKATSLGQAFGVLAQSLIDFNDSHLFFVPPSRTTSVQYDWRVQMIGNACFIVGVRPDSDAARQGVTRGDRVLAIDGFTPSRAQLWKQIYAYRLLSPRTAVTLKLERGGAVRDVTVPSVVQQRPRMLNLWEDFDFVIREAENAAAARRHRKVNLEGISVWKISDFLFDPEEGLRWGLDDAKDVILDLRGNPGGAVEVMEAVVGRFFDRPVTIAELKGRKPIKPMASTKAPRVFTGRIVVLIDSNSASAAELLARVMQIEKRAVVLGDRSSGSVRRSQRFEGKVGADPVVLFGASITNADVIMTDGSSIETVGVMPDEVILPAAEDLATGRDPVLARALAILGVAVDASQAGRLFPVEWK